MRTPEQNKHLGDKIGLIFGEYNGSKINYNIKVYFQRTFYYSGNKLHKMIIRPSIEKMFYLQEIIKKSNIDLLKEIEEPKLSIEQFADENKNKIQKFILNNFKDYEKF